MVVSRTPLFVCLILVDPRSPTRPPAKKQRCHSGGPETGKILSRASPDPDGYSGITGSLTDEMAALQARALANGRRKRPVDDVGGVGILLYEAPAEIQGDG